MLKTFSFSALVAATIISAPVRLVPASPATSLALATEATLVTNGACASATCVTPNPFLKCCENKKWVMHTLDADNGPGEAGCDDEE